MSIECHLSPSARAGVPFVDSRVARAAAALGLAFASTLAVAQDVYSSAGGNTGQWNPQGPLVCQVHADQYNELTPKIDAAAKARNTETKNDLTAQRSQKKADYQTCVQGNRPLLKGGVSSNAPLEETVHDQYGKGLPAMLGTVNYGGVTLTVETASNRLVGQGISGPVAIVSRPARFTRAEGYIETDATFVVTRLWERNGAAHNPGGLRVSIAPKGRPNSNAAARR